MSDEWGLTLVLLFRCCCLGSELLSHLGCLFCAAVQKFDLEFAFSESRMRMGTGFLQSESRAAFYEKFHKLKWYKQRRSYLRIRLLTDVQNKFGDKAQMLRQSSKLWQFDSEVLCSS